MKETISDIIDRRMDPSSASREFGRIAADEDHCRVWRDYHLIGDVIRGEVRSTGTCLVSRIQIALESESAVIATDRGTRMEHAPESTGRDQTITGAGRSRGDTLKAAGFFSLAASMALVAVITLVPQDHASRDSEVASRSTSIASGAGPVTERAVTNDSFDAEFGQMLAGHGEFTGSTGLNGLLTYAKLVSNQPLGE